MRRRMLIEHVMVMMANIRCRTQSSDRAQGASIGVVRCDRQVNIVQRHAETYRRSSRRSEEAKIRSCSVSHPPRPALPADRTSKSHGFKQHLRPKPFESATLRRPDARNAQRRMPYWCPAGASASRFSLSKIRHLALLRFFDSSLQNLARSSWVVNGPLSLVLFIMFKTL